MSNILIRPANEKDLSSLIDLLSQLTTVGTPNLIDSSIYNNIYVAIIQLNNKEVIVGTITVLIEPKIIHNGSKVAHIEDVVVNNDHRKMGIGKLLIEYAIKIARQEECYKIILDCDVNTICFYEKCGFNVKGVSMRLNLI